MTILIGILCEDGAVIAADGMASQHLGTTPFIGVDNLKIHSIEEKLILACAGDDNLMIQFVHFLKINYSTIISQNEQKVPFDVFVLMSEIGSKFAHYIVKMQNQFPPELQPSSIKKTNEKGFPFQAVLALYLNYTHYMCFYDNFFRPYMLRGNGIWHTILGSGHLVASPSIHLVKKILDIKSRPSVEQARILAYWTIQHAIEVSAGGIGGKITISSLRKIEDTYKIEEDTEGDLIEHDSFIKEMYKIMSQYRNRNSIEAENNIEIPVF